LRKVEAKSLELFWHDFIERQVNKSNSYKLLKGPHFWMAKNWQNSGFVAKFWTKFALFDERQMAFLAAKYFGAYLYTCNLFWLISRQVSLSSD